jgi:hypothetical protein
MSAGAKFSDTGAAKHTKPALSKPSKRWLALSIWITENYECSIAGVGTYANHSERMSTRIAFLIAGLLMSAWAPLVPLVKARAGLDDGGLGLRCLAWAVDLLWPCPSLVISPHTMDAARS